MQGDLAATCYFTATFFLAAATCFRTSAHRTLTGQRATATKAGKSKKCDVTNWLIKVFLRSGLGHCQLIRGLLRVLRHTNTEKDKLISGAMKT